MSDGGIKFEHVTLILGAEIEVFDEQCQGPIHVLCYFPKIEHMQQFSEWLTRHMKNITLSSQRYYGSVRALQYKVKELAGMFILAHVFTPFKSTYGKGVKQSLTEVFDPDLIDGVELGLSADTLMADDIKELHDYTYLSNSDAHSLAKIGREYQTIKMAEPTFKEFYWALHNVNGRHVSKNYGMNPELGKYYSTVCKKCLTPMSAGISVCPICHSTQIVKGVADRIKELADTTNQKSTRPAYLHQVPLEYLPKLGPKTYQKLLHQFRTEMFVIHEAKKSVLEKVVSRELAQTITEMREGKLSIKAGGGGRYGRLK